MTKIFNNQTKSRVYLMIGIWLLVISSSLFPAAFGEEPPPTTPAQQAAPVAPTPPAQPNELRLVVGELHALEVESLQRVAIGDPEIADVNVISNKEMLLVPKAPGQTVLIIWDKLGQRSINVMVTTVNILAQVEQLKRILKALKVAPVEFKIEGEKIFLMGEVPKDSDLTSIEKAIAVFPAATSLVKLKESKPLVQINVDVLEVGRDDLDRIGADWDDSVLFTEQTPATSSFWKLWRVEEWDRESLSTTINALIEEGKARTLANPSIMTASGKEANILVGGEIPIVTVESYARTSVKWKPYGVLLSIKPTVISRDEVNTTVKVEVSDLDWANAVEYQGLNVPAMKKRSAETELYLKDKGTLIIAGLIKNEEAKNIDRLPFLSDVPVLGNLYKSTSFSVGQTELVVALTPKILEKEGFWPPEEGQLGALSDLEEGAQSKLEVLKKLEEQVRQKEQQARQKKKELASLQEAEKEKIKKFEEIIAVLGQEKAGTQQKLEELKNQQGLIKQEEDKLKEEKEKVSSYLNAEKTKLKMVEKIKQLRGEIEELLRQTSEQPPYPLPEALPEEQWPQKLPEGPSEQEQQRLQAMEEELGKLESLKRELLKAKSLQDAQAAIEVGPRPVEPPEPPAQEQQKKDEVIKALKAIEEKPQTNFSPK